jgi:hypothetical protein
MTTSPLLVPDETRFMLQTQKGHRHPTGDVRNKWGEGGGGNCRTPYRQLLAHNMAVSNHARITYQERKKEREIERMRRGRVVDPDPGLFTNSGNGTGIF